MRTIPTVNSSHDPENITVNSSLKNRCDELHMWRVDWLPNKWQYCDEYIIVIVVLREKTEKNTIKNCKKVAWVVFKPGIDSYNGGHVHRWTTARAGDCCWPSLLNYNRNLLPMCTVHVPAIAIHMAGRVYRHFVMDFDKFFRQVGHGSLNVYFGPVHTGPSTFLTQVQSDSRLRLRM